jgi:hypothetical protein
MRGKVDWDKTRAERKKESEAHFLGKSTSVIFGSSSGVKAYPIKPNQLLVSIRIDSRRMLREELKND